MSKISKTFALFLTLIIALSWLTILMVKPASAQSIPKPSVPDFTFKVMDESYVEPLVYSTNPFTGETELVRGGNTVQKGRIEITIKNQPFTPYIDEKGGNVSLHYIFEFKGHFTDWDNLFDSYAGKQSNLEYTNIVLTYGEGSTLHGEHLGYLQGQIDFRVKAELGYWTSVEAFPDYEYSFTGEISDWSNTQTIDLTDISVSDSTSPNPTPTSTVPELSLLAIIPLIIALIPIALVKMVRKRKLSLLSGSEEFLSKQAIIR